MTTWAGFEHLRLIFLSLFFLARPFPPPRPFSRVTRHFFLAWQRYIYRPFSSEILV